MNTRTLKSWKFWLITLVASVLLIALIAVIWLRSSLPQIDGTVRIEGLTSEITIHRDSHGVPHIIAPNRDDLAFGLAYAHAQDRLWQMEVNRRIGRGELAEILGSSAVGFDRFFRTLGFRHKAAAALSNLPENAVRTLERYRDGVNAYLQTRSGALPPEFILTGTEPRPWDVIDTLVWQKMMWLDLSGNARHEIARARLLAKLSPDQVASLYAPYPGEEEQPLPDLSTLYRHAPIEETALALGPAKPPGYGSNNWVVSGDHTQSGLPLLANDPHLGLNTPSIWYLARLHNSSTGKNTVGVSFPGSPAIVLGRNDRVAWGFTNTAPDIQDLFIEKLVDDTHYLTPDGPRPFIERTETIRVKDADDIVLTVRETRHGPVVSDIYPGSDEITPDGHVIAMQWTALRDEDMGVVGLSDLGDMENFEQFKAAGEYYAGPQQNMIYADVDGNIGYFAPGLVPVRHPDNEIGGRLPSPGWDAKYDWQGFIPYNELPERLNPNGGVIATANEKIVDDTYPHFITGDWALPYRGNRIRAEIASSTQHTLESFGALQADQVSDMARDILPWMMEALEQSTIRSMLRNWNGEMSARRPEPLIFYTWLRHYQRLLISDELGDLYAAFTRQQPQLIKSSLYWSAQDNQSDTNDQDWNTGYYALPVQPRDRSIAWCDDVSTEAEETCAGVANRAMAETIAELSGRHGDDPAAWRWGSEHQVIQSHRPMSQIDALKDMFELRAPIGGGRYTVNVAGVSQNKATLNASLHGPSYRGLFDLSDLEKSLYTQPTGQSGNPMSVHYSDLFDGWKAVDYFEIPTRTLKPEDTEGTLVLTPAKK